MTDEPKPTWKNTFNSWFRMWGHCDRAVEAATNAGYPYFEWNCRVYSVQDTGLEHPICLAIEMD